MNSVDNRGIGYITVSLLKAVAGGYQRIKEKYSYFSKNQYKSKIVQLINFSQNGRLVIFLTKNADKQQYTSLFVKYTDIVDIRYTHTKQTENKRVLLLTGL